jgi:hypothetical protein
VKTLTAIGIAAVALGCGAAENPPPAPATRLTPTDEADKPITPAHRERDQLYLDIAGKVGGGTCDEFAAKLTGWVSANGSRIRALEREINDPVDIDEHLVDAFEVILERASDCVDSDAAQAAFEAFDELFMGG